MGICRGFSSSALIMLALSESGALAAPPVYRIDHVTDGDTVVLRNGQRVRLVQIDTPEVFFGRECYGRLAARQTKALLTPGTRVRLLPEPATDRVDQHGRLLRYVIRVRRCEREHPSRRYRCGRALLLSAPQGQVRESTGRSSQAGADEEARALAYLSSHSI